MADQDVYDYESGEWNLIFLKTNIESELTPWFGI